MKDEEDERGLIFSEKISLIRRASTCSWPWHSSQKMLKFSMILFLLRKIVDFRMWYKRNFELIYFVSLSWCLWVQKKVSFVFSCKRPPLSTILTQVKIGNRYCIVQVQIHASEPNSLLHFENSSEVKARKSFEVDKWFQCNLEINVTLVTFWTLLHSVENVLCWECKSFQICW